MARDKIYWSLIAVAAVALVCAYFVWVRPFQRRVDAERAALQRCRGRVAELFKARGGIPSQKALERQRDYRSWARGEFNQHAVPLFALCDKALEKHLIEDPHLRSPTRFKGAYRTEREQILSDLRRGCPGMSLPKNLFAGYGWADGAALPREGDFLAVRRDINIRHQLLSILGRHKVAAIEELEVGRAEPGDEPWHLIPVSLEVVLAPEQVMPLLRSLLQVRWDTALRAQRLCMLVRKLRLARPDKPPEGREAVRLELSLAVVDFPDAFRENATEAAEE